MIIRVSMGLKKRMRDIQQDLRRDGKSNICPRYILYSPTTIVRSIMYNDCKICSELFPNKDSVCPCRSEYTPQELIQMLEDIIQAGSFTYTT